MRLFSFPWPYGVRLALISEIARETRSRGRRDRASELELAFRLTAHCQSISRCRLSTELIEQILDEFHPYASIDSQDLLRISGVNRAWRAVARERLYKTIYVQSPKDEVLEGFWGLLERLGRLPGPRVLVDDDWDDSDDEGNIGEGVPAKEPARLSMDVTSQRLWHVLNENQGVANIVEEIVFQGPFETDHAANAIRRFLWVCQPPFLPLDPAPADLCARIPRRRGCNRAE